MTQCNISSRIAPVVISLDGDHSLPATEKKSYCGSSSNVEQFETPEAFLLEQQRRGHELVNEYKRKKSLKLDSKVKVVPVTPQTPLSTIGVRNAVNTKNSVDNKNSEPQKNSFSFPNLVLETSPITEAKKHNASIARRSEEPAKSSISASSSANTSKHLAESGVENQPVDEKGAKGAKSRKTPTQKAKKSRWSKAKRYSRMKESKQDSEASLPSQPVEVPTKRLTPFSNRTYQLVLVTTVETFGRKRIDLPTNNTFAMFSMFQKQFSFRALIFTNSKAVQRACRHFRLAYDSDYE